MQKQRKKVLTKNIQPGDVFAFQLSDDLFGFGVIVSKVLEGHVAELYGTTASIPVLDLANAHPVLQPPVILDTYSLFQIGREGVWVMLGQKPDYAPSKATRATRFAWGIRGDQNAMDVHGASEPISDAEALKMPRARPFGDFDVKEVLKKIPGYPSPTRASFMYDHTSFPPLLFLDNGEDSKMLLTDDAMVRAQDVFAGAGRMSNGYAWEAIARRLAVEAFEEGCTLDFSAEAGMLSVSGPSEQIQALARALQRLFEQPNALAMLRHSSGATSER